MAIENNSQSNAAGGRASEIQQFLNRGRKLAQANPDVPLEELSKQAWDDVAEGKRQQDVEWSNDCTYVPRWKGKG